MNTRSLSFVLLASATLLAPAAAPKTDGAPAASGGGPRVIVYDRPGFRGASLTLAIGADFADLARVRLDDRSRADDRIASIQIEPGASVRFWVDRDFRGEPVTLIRSVENLADLPRGGGASWADCVSALRVEQNPRLGDPDTWSDPAAQPRVILFRHAGFGGESIELFPGEKIENLKKTRFDGGGRKVGGEVSSIRVVGALRVRVNAERRFRGDEAEITADAADLQALPRGSGGKATWDDCIASIRVERAGP